MRRGFGKDLMLKFQGVPISLWRCPPIMLIVPNPSSNKEILGGGKSLWKGTERYYWLGF
jgi:hypothetical protein